MFRKDDIWNFTMPLPNTNLTLRGHSRGSEKSCFYIPEVGLYFDAGIAPCSYAKSVFITHGHHDHSEELPKYASGFNIVNKPYPLICVPEEAKGYFQAFLDSSYNLCKHTSDNGHIRVKGTSPGEIVDLNQRDYFVEVFDLIHGVMPTRAYGLCQNRRKLNPKYTSLPKEEIIELKKHASDFYVQTINKLVVYICDTCIQGWEMNPDFTKYKNVIIECTFLGDDVGHPNHHITWKELEPEVHNNPNVNFILIHFSARYETQYIKDYFEGEKIPTNVYVWLN